jgi:glucosyl-dolichyl phosphate glucuronosyltransferase
MTIGQSKSPLIISVIICTYNRAQLLKNVLQDVCQQTLVDFEFEVIVVDNHSTDQTHAVAKGFCQRYSNVRYCFETQQGLSHARNRGWHEAQGEYLAYLDDDCQVPTQWLAVAKEIIEFKAPIVFGGPYYAFYNTAKPHWWKKEYDAYHSMSYAETAGDLALHQDIHGGNLFIQQAILEKVGGFNPHFGMSGNQLSYGEETELQMRIFNALPECRAYSDPKLYVYHLVAAKKMKIGWIIQALMAQGRAQYHLAPRNLMRFGIVINCLWRFVELAKNIIIVFFSLVFKRDKSEHPYWQNHLYESQRFREGCCSLFGFLYECARTSLLTLIRHQPDKINR